MWNCAYQIYPRTIKVVSILSKLIFLDLKPCFFEKRVSKEISYIVYISAILPNIVYISLVSLKKISLRPAQESAVFFYSEISGFRVPGPMSYGTIGSVGPCHWKAKEKSWWGDEGEGSEDELHWEAL